MPARDVRLSPDHAVLVRGALIPVRYLLNARTIVQERARRIVYWHVELDRHDVLLADGLAAESYLDTGNRDAFAGQARAALHPGFGIGAMDIWARDACTRLVLDGPELSAARHMLAVLAARLGHRLTGEPGLRLMTGGTVVSPRWRDGVRYRFVLPAGVRDVRLASAAAVPAHIADTHPDHRRLGVMVTSLRVDGCRVDLAGLGDGWHAPERRGARHWRWTDGAALLPPGCRVELTAHALPTGYVAQRLDLAVSGRSPSRRRSHGIGIR